MMVSINVILPLCLTYSWLIIPSASGFSSGNLQSTKNDIPSKWVPWIDGIQQEIIPSSCFSLQMKKTASESSSSVTQLWYKDTSQQHDSSVIDDNNWVGKWFEDNLHPLLQFPQRQRYSSKVNSNMNRQTEVDSKMPGSTITHLAGTREYLFQNIEELPCKSPMIYNMNGTSSSLASMPENFKHSKSSTISSDQQNVPSSSPHEHFEKVSYDLSHLSISIASAIESPEQWTEFCDNTGGLENILKGIHAVVDEIQGRSIDATFEPLLCPDEIGGFHTACCACRVLRDLCAKDTLWASAITDEILRWNRDGTIISDLVFLLRHTDEAERIYSKKAWRMRRMMKKNRFYAPHLKTRKQRRDSRRKCRLYISQLLLVMATASDEAITEFRRTPGLVETVRSFSSYTRQEKISRKWIKYPFEKMKRLLKRLRNVDDEDSSHQTAFLAAASMKSGILGEIQRTSNKLLAALGHNVFIPKTPGQRGLRILSLDGGGTRGIASIAIMKSIVDSLGGIEICDSFDLIAGTSTGAIIAFLVGLRRESNKQAKKRYDELIEKIFVKNSLSTPMMLFTTATYSEVPFKQIMMDILGDNSMIDSRADPRVPLVFCVSTKMSSTTSKMCLFRNYNYSGGEKNDNFVVSPKEARRKLGFISEPCDETSLDQIVHLNTKVASRHEGSFRILQRAALRATTAAPTVFKPVLLGTDMYSDGGLVASNPAAVAIHEARTIYPDIPIECVVSLGTGEFVSEKVSPSFGWDGIVSQIVNSALDTSKTHWVLQDILGQGATTNPSSFTSTKYFRFDPMIGKPTDFPIDGTDPIRLELLSKLASDYMQEPEQQKKLQEMTHILKGKLF